MNGSCCALVLYTYCNSEGNKRRDTGTLGRELVIYQVSIKELIPRRHVRVAVCSPSTKLLENILVLELRHEPPHSCQRDEDLHIYD